MFHGHLRKKGYSRDPSLPSLKPVRLCLNARLPSNTDIRHLFSCYSDTCYPRLAKTSGQIQVLPDISTKVTSVHTVGCYVFGAYSSRQVRKETQNSLIFGYLVDIPNQTSCNFCRFVIAALRKSCGHSDGTFGDDEKSPFACLNLGLLGRSNILTKNETASCPKTHESSADVFSESPPIRIISITVQLGLGFSCLPVDMMA